LVLREKLRPSGQEWRWEDLGFKFEIVDLEEEG
jgi:hypothetical protein